MEKENIILSQQDRRKTMFRICVLIFLAALLFRLVELALNPLLSRDAALYLTQAELWYETGDYTKTLLPGNEVPPLQLWTIKTIMALGCGAEVAGRTMSLFLGSLLPAVAFLLAWKIGGRIRIALVAALLTIVHSELASYSYQPLRENYYLFFEGLLLVFLVDAARKDAVWKWCICGILFSLAFFSRYEILEFLLLIPLLLAFLVFRRRMKLKRAFANISAFYLFSGLTFLSLLSLVDFDITFLARFTYYLNKLFFKSS